MEPRKKITEIEVESWRDIPGQQNSTLDAMAIPSKRRIYTIKGKTTEAERMHEIGHIVKGHSDREPYKAENFVREEIEAHLYAYQRLGKPKSILLKLRAIFNDLTHNYRISPPKAKALLRRNIMQPNVPKQWKLDYYKLEKEYRKVFG